MQLSAAVDEIAQAKADRLVEPLRAEAETAIAKLQSDASARVELTRRDLEAQIARMEADAEVVSFNYRTSSQRQSSLLIRRELKHGSRTTVLRALRSKQTSASVARGLKLKIGSCGSRPTWRRLNYAPTAPNNGWC